MPVSLQLVLIDVENLLLGRAYFSALVLICVDNYPIFDGFAGVFVS